MKRKKILAIALLWSICMQAEVLLVEDFDYTIGQSLTECGSWYLQWAGGDDKLSITNGLELQGYAQSGIGNAVLIDGESSSAIPHIALPQPVTSGSVYAAMMIQATLPVGKGGWIASFRDNQLTSTDFNENGRLLINDANQLGIAVAQPTGTSGYASKVLDGQKVYLVVVKYTIVPGDKNDQCSLYVLDSVVTAEPATPDVGPLSDSGVADINPANFLLRGFDDEAWIVVDGIRIATTWQEALGVKTTGLEVAGDGLQATGVRKYVEKGQLVMEKNGQQWSATGSPIKYVFNNK